MTLKETVDQTDLAAPSPHQEALGLTPGQAALKRARHHLGLQLGLGMLLVMGVFALLAPWLAPHDPYLQNLSLRLLPPAWVDGGQWHYVLGTDHLGRDYLSRIIYGARISMMIGLGAATIGALIGVTLGIIAGYFGGWLDQAVNFLVTCQLAVPSLLLIMALVFVIGQSITVVIFVIGATHWVFYLVVTRAATLRIRELDFVAAAGAMGASKWQIAVKEILPNLVNQIMVIFTLEVAVAILNEATLSFLGLGVPSPIPSWGLMIAEGKTAMFFQPWLVILPGIALFVLVIAINLLGDGVRDVTVTNRRS
ncbi:ABC transporter permease [Alcanivorax marinus]|uniref:ABC transporter permease n=1 Tax=Alloalcanivorax marinus TaxID=1177169 RepID=A0A9Q3ULG6_9GAMM|nr:ABC transporter permease [Alloalcanivorax marinus]MCC4307198.1 ABC transporter permease [Alloalcanivorax marinus]MCU5787093.1 permease protein, ABC-type oligopeptide transporter [Alloalcanivorax marinus]